MNNSGSTGSCTSKKRSPTYKPLRVPDAISEVTPKEIVQKQQTDQTLEKLRTLA